MSIKINRVARMADLPAVLAENLRSWPHYRATSDTAPEDAYESMGETWDPLTTQGPERQEWRLTGYANAGPTSEGYRLWILRMGRSTFVSGVMHPESTHLTIAHAKGTKAGVEAWVDEQLALDLEPARQAGTIAYNAGRPNVWREFGKWGAEDVTDPRMADLVSGVWGLSRERLGRAFSAAWEDNAAHDRARTVPTDKRKARRLARRAARAAA